MDTIKNKLFSSSSMKSLGSPYTILIVAIVTSVIFTVFLYKVINEDIDNGCDNAPLRVNILLFFMSVLTLYLVSLAISSYSYYKPVDQ